MAKSKDKSVACDAIGTVESSSDSVPIARSGIGTRISALSEDLGSRKVAASVMGVSTDSLQRYIREDNTPPFDVAARLCSAAGARMEWLATGHGPKLLQSALRVGESPAMYGIPSQDLSVEHLTIAIELADEALRGLWLPRSGYAELVALVYNALMQGLPYAAILDIARPAAKQRAGQGAGDDSEQGVGRSGPEGVGRGAAA